MIKCSHITEKPSVEFVLFLILFSRICASTINANFIIYRTCYVTLNYNESDCALLGRNYSDKAIAELEKKVQPYATDIITTTSIILAICPPIMCFFFGPWSDTYGRKPVLLLTIGATIISFLIHIIIVALPSASPWFLLLITVPHCLTGGLSALITVSLCFITDVTSEEQRGFRMGLFEGLIALGTVLGQSLSSFILDAGGYFTIYTICAVCACVAWLYTFIVIPETVVNVKTQDRFRNLFKFSLLKSTIKTTMKERGNYERPLLLLTILIMTVAIFSNFGNTEVLFLYLRGRFYWTLLRYALYSSVVSVTGIIGAIFGVFLLHKILNIGEVVVMFIGFLSALVSALLQGHADSNWQIYFAGIAKCLSGAIGPMVRCFLSKLVSPKDSGKVFAMLTSLEQICALFGVTVYTKIYNSTLTSFPEAFSFLSGGLYGFEVILISIVFVLEKLHIRRRDYEEFDGTVV